MTVKAKIKVGKFQQQLMRQDESLYLLWFPKISDYIRKNNIKNEIFYMEGSFLSLLTVKLAKKFKDILFIRHLFNYENKDTFIDMIRYMEVNVIKIIDIQYIHNKQ